MIPVAAESDPPAPSFNRAVFLDRDGVINRVLIREGKVFSPRKVEEFDWEEGIFEAVKVLKADGYLVIVVTNQPDIARGKMDQEVLATMTAMIYEKMPVDEVMVCPHDDQDGCRCRKPKAGMLIEAGEKWGIDYRRSFIIGDNWKDMEAGRAANCTAILLNRSYNQGVDCDWRVADLREAVGIVRDQEK